MRGSETGLRGYTTTAIHRGWEISDSYQPDLIRFTTTGKYAE